jgi:solute carrier family 25 (mitochondrial thiamine pyrophosphate transporter), member 19
MSTSQSKIVHISLCLQCTKQGTRKQVILSGGIAGLVSRFCIAPLDVVKIRLQLQTHSLSEPLSSHRGIHGPLYKGTVSTLQAIVQQEGITGLWKGNIPAELLYICYGGIQFVTYRSVAQLQARLLPYRPSQALESFISGASAGAAATAAAYPLDLLRTRFAAQGNDRIYANLLTSIRDIAHHEGPRGFFQGLTASLGQIVPYMGFFFASYESLRLLLGDLELPFGSGDATAGILASTLSKTGVFPLDLARKRLQVQGPTRTRYIHRNIPEYKGVLDTLQTVFRKEGIRGMYRGLTVSLVKAAPASAVTMWTYERSLQFLMARAETIQ